MEELTFSLRNIVINYVKHGISVLYYGIQTRVEKGQSETQVLFPFFTITF